MGLAADQHILYLATDGSEMSYEDFGKRVRAGGTFNAEKAPEGTMLLRLKTPTRPAAPTGSSPAFLPALQLTTIDGRAVSSADFTERPLLLSFFFSKCVPCIQEVAVLNAFAGQHPEYRYLAVTFDPKEEAARFVQQYNLQWPVVAGAQDFIAAAGVVAYPAYLLISTQGQDNGPRLGG